MTSFLRNSRSIRPIDATIRTSTHQRQGRRLYSHSSYGGEGEVKSKDGRNKPTRGMEHPGPPPPNVSKGTSGVESQRQSGGELEEDISMEPSNNPHPTITDGRQSVNVDKDGNSKPDVPEDVKRHNEEIDQRYDKPYNRIKDEGKVGKGFWKLDGAQGY
ncbi:uncharacterized protein BJX67DRAFT_380103 [Aspergillus lucknowensis]|uniref:Uncharacterized protein n=1 Tax=Aspergillus lucknowensis TaxID=176173 RepID=A0ABR4LUS1_9EURO